MSKVMGIGVIGAGNISTSYLTRAAHFKGIEMRAIADLNMETAQAQADRFNIRAETVDAVLAAEDIDIVVNLTVPKVHAQVTANILRAGKHAYSEKPLCLSMEEGRMLADLSAETSLRIGCAPDTFLGGSHQEVRKLVDEGAIGRVTHGTAHVMSAGMEMWHPNPDFFFQAGGGPVLDMGPYYIAFLVNILGPVRRVAAMSNKASETRTITSAPRNGETIPVEVPTTVHGLLEFAEGAIITFGASWDCSSNGHRNLELYGTKGTIIPRDPNFFGGDVTVIDRDGSESVHDGMSHPLSTPNKDDNGVMLADYRAVGLADMAQAIGERRDHRCSFERALHVTEVLDSLLVSGETNGFVEMTTSCTRPAAFGPEDAHALMT